jgi:2-hydroxychromene-2-carboxylate isomerase
MPAPDAAFYFDLVSPEAYLAAERILHVLGAPAEWQPVLARELPGAESFEASRSERVAQSAAGRLAETGMRAEGECLPASVGPLFFDQKEEEIFRGEIERRAHAQDLQPLKWPSPFPFDSALAMRIATYAKSIGRTVPFAQAAFRQAFAGGRNLAEMDNVLIAAAACEMHPAAVSNAAELRSVAEQLATTTALAAQAGVTGVPAVRVGERVWTGERAVEDAAAHMRTDRVGGALP